MTLTQLRYIIAVDTYRHFVTAAEKCFVTQPTLSMQIHKLENELGVLVFDRSKQPVEPTPIGKQIVEQGRRILQEADRVNEIIQEGKGEIAGEFHLGIIPTVASSLLPRFLKEFSETYPLVRLRIEELKTPVIIERLRKDLLDAAILATPLEERGIIEQPLYYEPLMAFIPDGHQMAGQKHILNSDIEMKELLLLNEGHCFRNNVLNLCRPSKQTTVEENKPLTLESGNFETLIKLVRQGFGITLIPYLVALELDPEDRHSAIPFSVPHPSREISMVYTRAQLKIQIINALRDVILKSIPSKLLNAQDSELVSPVIR